MPQATTREELIEKIMEWLNLDWLLRRNIEDQELAKRILSNNLKSLEPQDNAVVEIEEDDRMESIWYQFLKQQAKPNRIG